MKLNHLLSIVLLAGLGSCAEKSRTSSLESTPDHIDVLFYNVENLFDTKNDRRTLDDDFTPEGRNAWTDDRYQTKLKHLAEVIKAADHGAGLPAIIGLSEIENANVCKVLGNKVANGAYRLVHKDSKDRRGIDMALLYRKDLINVIKEEAIEIDFASGYTSRDILYAELELANKERLHVFLNHWPSRRDGQMESEYRRLAAAEMLRSRVQSIQAAEVDAQIILLGDFNDYPDNKSMARILNAQPEDGKADGELINLAYELHANGKGTYNYKGEWGMLDQAIVSDALLVKKGLYAGFDALEIHQRDFMMYYDKRAREKKPSRTYGGPKYYGGYSDHLPILLHLELAKD